MHDEINKSKLNGLYYTCQNITRQTTDEIVMFFIMMYHCFCICSVDSWNFNNVYLGISKMKRKRVQYADIWKCYWKLKIPFYCSIICVLIFLNDMNWDNTTRTDRPSNNSPVVFFSKFLSWMWVLILFQLNLEFN